MDAQAVVEFFGGPACTARAMVTSPQNISGWLADGIPRSRQYEVQVKSRGTFIAEGWDPARDYRGIKP